MSGPTKEEIDSITVTAVTETEIASMKALAQRWQLGRAKYDTGISYKQSDDPINWVQQAIEEAADQLQYLVALKLRLENDKK